MTQDANIDLVRVAVGPEGAFGVLIERGYPFAVTCERTFDREPFVKIPGGMFHCRRTWFFRGGYETFEIPVAGFSRLLFHRGNVEGDSEGCVLVGRRFGALGGQPAVLDSKRGFADFIKRTKGRADFLLSVRGVDPRGENES